LELTAPFDDPDAKQKAGDRVTVRGVDDGGHLLVAWDMGSSLNLIPGLDSFQLCRPSRMRSSGKSKR
jgi:hypothetical protein